MMPIGRQCASGLSLLLPATRSLSTAWAHGVNGSPSLMFAATSRKPATGGPLCGGGGVAPCLPRPPTPRQTPERSGLPSTVRGAGAVRFGSDRKTGDRRSALWWRRRGALPAEAAHAAPDTREIGFAVDGARRRRGEIRFALLRFRRVLRRAPGPLRLDRGRQ